MEEGRNMALSRRQFLAGVGVAGVAAAGAGLVGCAPASSGGSGEPKGPSGAGTSLGSDDGLIASASLNPQDYEYRQNTTDFGTLFSPWKLGGIELSHRMVKLSLIHI